MSTEEMPQRYILYIRASTKEQEISLEMQRKEMLEFIEKKGHKEVPYLCFYDTITTEKPIDKRDGLIEALGTLRRGDVFLIWKRDRLSRLGSDDGEYYTLLRTIEHDRKATLRSVMNDTHGMDPFMKKVMEMVDMIVAYKERIDLKLRTKTAMALKRSKGECLGKPHYGTRIKLKYVIGQDKPTKILEPDDYEQTVIQIIRAKRREGKNLHEIERELWEQGIRNRAGKRLLAKTVQRILLREPEELEEMLPRAGIDPVVMAALQSEHKCEVEDYINEELTLGLQ